MLKTAAKRKIAVGPADHGKCMTLDQFDNATGREGFTYELSKGVVEVSGIPHPQHATQVDGIRRQLNTYQDLHEGVVHLVLSGSESKILLASEQSERHPDLCVYLQPPPDLDDVWSVWVPAIVVEVVSKSSAKRDYEEKPAEYLAFGIDEYWIVDGFKKQMTAMTRWRGQWKPKVLKASQSYTTSHLPGFTLKLKRVFAAGR